MTSSSSPGGYTIADDNSNNNNNKKINKNRDIDDSIIITPLPYYKIALLGTILAVNNSSIWMIFSFLPFMITNFFPQLNKTEIGYKAGILGSSFSAGSLIGNFVSSIISDNYGRRPALLLGLLGTTLTSALFGFSSHFWLTVIIRFFWGMLNGNIGVAKTYLAEICDDSNLPKAMSYFGVVGGIGRTIGPIIGGFLSLPADKYHIFKNTIFETYPYSLPSLIISNLCLIVFIISYFTLIETKQFDNNIINKNNYTVNDVNNNDVNNDMKISHLSPDHKNSGNSFLFSSIRGNSRSSRSNGNSSSSSNRRSSNNNDNLLSTKYSILKTTEEDDDDFEHGIENKMMSESIDGKLNVHDVHDDDIIDDIDNNGDIQLTTLINIREDSMNYIDIDYEISNNGYDEAKIPLNMMKRSTSDNHPHNHQSRSSNNSNSNNSKEVRDNRRNSSTMNNRAHQQQVVPSLYSDDDDHDHDYNDTNRNYNPRKSISFLNIVKVKEIDTNLISFKKLKQVTTSDVPVATTLSTTKYNHNNNNNINIDIINKSNIDVLIYSNGAELNDDASSSSFYYITQQSYINKIIYLLKQSHIFISCTLYGIASLLAIMISEIFPLWVILSPENGGFNYDERMIGISIMICGIASMISQVTLYGNLVQTYGILKVYRLSFILYAISVALMPLASLTINISSGHVSWIIVIIMLFLQNIGTQWSLVCNFVLISNSCYSHQRASVNAIGQTCASLGRMVGPYIASIIFAWSLNNGLTWPLNYNFIFYILSILAFINYRYSFLLPKSIQRRKREPKRHEKEIIDTAIEIEDNSVSPLMASSSYDVMRTNKDKNRYTGKSTNNSIKSTSRSSSISSSSSLPSSPSSYSKHSKTKDVKDVENNLHDIDSIT